MNTSSPAATCDGLLESETRFPGAPQPLLTVEQLITRIVNADDIDQRERWADCLRLRIDMDKIMACANARNELVLVAAKALA